MLGTPDAHSGRSLERQTVLLVDDDAAVRQLVGAILRQHGYTVMEAFDGAEGLRICAQHQGPIHLLLTDVQMPRMSGPRLAPLVLAIRPQTLILYMSAQPREAVQAPGGLEPTVPFLQKPFAPDTLMRTVRDLLGSTR